MVIQILKTLNDEKTSNIGAQSRGSYIPMSRVGSAHPFQSCGTKDSKIDYYRDEADLV